MFDRIGQEVRPRVWTVFAACLLSVLLAPIVRALAFAMFTVIGIATRLMLNPGIASQGQAVGAPVREALRSLAGAFTLISATALLAPAIAVAGALMSRERVGNRLGLGRTRLKPAAWIPAMLGSVALAFVLGVAKFLAGLPPIPPPPSNAVAVGLLLVGSLVVAPGQELLFRGYAQARLCERWGSAGGVLLSALLSSVLQFGTPHLPWHFYPPAFVYGVFLGWLAQRTGCVQVPMAVRAMTGAVLTGMPMLGFRLPASRGADAALLAGAAGVMVFSVVWLVRCSSGSRPVAADLGAWTAGT